MTDEIADLVERTALHVGNTKKLASEMRVAGPTIRDWISRPQRLPLCKLPELIHLADPSDPFLSRLAAHLGYRLVPICPTPEEIVEALIEDKAIVPGKERTAHRIVRGLDRRQAELWGPE